MSISPVAAAADAATGTQATSDRARLSDNYDTFLVLLTAQLQNQDPLSPMDSAQFTQQLVQFSQVEQQIRTNEQLGSLVSHYQAASAGAALSYLGRDALIESNQTSLINGAAAWSYSLPASADQVTLSVNDSHGRTVFETSGQVTAGAHMFNWNGQDADGTQLPDGPYTMVVTAKNSDGTAIPVTTTVREQIRGVDFSGSSPLVITATGSRGLDTIRAVLDGGG